MTEQQEIKFQKMHTAHAHLNTVLGILKYLQKKLGTDNSLVVDYIFDIVDKSQIDYQEKLQDFKKAGGIDALIKYEFFDQKIINSDTNSESTTNAEISEKATIDLLFEEYGKAMKAVKPGQVFPHWFDHEQLKWIKTVLDKR